jgi:hypothetical protein
MLLRRSGEKENQKYNLNQITGEDEVEAGPSHVGVPEEAFLLELAETVFYGDSQALVRMREKGRAVLGDQGLVDAIGVAAGFNGITKIANATGLPLDADTETSTVDMRQQTRIDEFGDAHKSQIYL